MQRVVEELSGGFDDVSDADHPVAQDLGSETTSVQEAPQDSLLTEAL